MKSSQKIKVSVLSNKGRGVAAMDRSKYTDECLDILQNKQFTLLKHDATKSIENKIRQELRKLNTKN